MSVFSFPRRQARCCAKAFDCVDHNKLWKIQKARWAKATQRQAGLGGQTPGRWPLCYLGSDHLPDCQTPWRSCG